MASNGCSLCFWSLKKPAGVSGHPDRLQACEPGNPVTDWPMKKGAPIGPTKTQLSNVKWPVDHCQLKNLTGFLVVGCWKNVKCMAPSTLLAGSHVIAESNFIFFWRFVSSQKFWQRSITTLIYWFQYNSYRTLEPTAEPTNQGTNVKCDILKGPGV